ncbi:MAG: 4-fold beta flower protein [Ignavibacteriales bacterium]
MIADWLYDQNSEARFYLEEDRFISKSGKPLATLEGDKVVSITGEVLGTFSHGAVYDMDDRPIAVIETGRGYIPDTSEILGGAPDDAEYIPTDEDLTEAPGDPGISGVPVKPLSGDWSDMTLEEFFGTDL